jgi:hypothetical protein
LGKVYHYSAAPEFRDVEVCPVPPEPLVSLPELAAPPLWALATVCWNSGKRGPKYEIVRPNYGAWNQTYPYDDYGTNTHGVLWTEAQRKRTLKKSKLEEKVSARKVAKRGSLSEDDYRFWAGSQYQEMHGPARCRWCDAWRYGKDQRKTHLSEEECNRKLLALYKFAAHRKPMKCFACDSVTQSKRWGLPLCATVECIERWKFSSKVTWSGLAEQFRIAQEAGVFDSFKEA